MQLGEIGWPVSLKVHLDLGQASLGLVCSSLAWQELDAVFVAPEVAIANQVVLLGRKLDRVAEVCLRF